MTRTIVIVGPTAVGKTDLSLDLAQALDAEIVNADSMQLYRGMDIGTAKVAFCDRRGIPHHMLDVLDVTESASVAAFQSQARAVIADIHAQGKVAVVVGGSGLFVNALLDDMQFPGSDAAVRARLGERLARVGPAALYEELMAQYPEAASAILPSNGRRIVRALEVIAITGSPPVTHLGTLPVVVPSLRIGLRRDRADLDERIARRVSVMFDMGLVREVEELELVGLREGLTASKALGYQQVLAALAGETTMEQAVADTVVGTRRFARRQESWFARDPHIHWFSAGDVSAAQIAVLADLQSGQS